MTPVNTVQWWSEWGNVAQLGGAIFTVCAIIIALCKEDIVKYWRQPVLTPRINLFPPDSFKETWKYRSSTKAYQTNRYIFRLWVENQGKTTAEKVQIYAAKLYGESGEGEMPIQVADFVPMNLIWSHTKREQKPEGDIFWENISPGMGRHCDLGHIINPGAPFKPDIEEHPKALPRKTVFALEVDFWHLGKSYLLLPGTYRLEIIIAAANSRPARKVLRIKLTGNWSDDQETMFSDGIFIEML